MRSISAAGLTKLAKKLGNESVIIVEIQWSEGGSKQLYGDVDVPAEGVRGVIQDVGGLDNVITISGVSQGTTSDSQELSFTFDDTDGSIKNILDNTDIHKRPVWVYQWFTGLMKRIVQYASMLSTKLKMLKLVFPLRKVTLSLLLKI
jgi:hypothetical protein